MHQSSRVHINFQRQLHFSHNDGKSRTQRFKVVSVVVFDKNMRDLKNIVIYSNLKT